MADSKTLSWRHLLFHEKAVSSSGRFFSSLFYSGAVFGIDSRGFFDILSGLRDFRAQPKTRA